VENAGQPSMEREMFTYAYNTIPQNIAKYIYYSSINQSIKCNWKQYVTSGCPYKLCSRVFQSRVFHPCKTGPPFSSLAISTHAIWSRVFQSCIFQSRVFSVPPRST